MLDQLVDLVRNLGQQSVVENPEVPNEYNKDVMADASTTIASGFQNVLAGGGFQNILDLFKGQTGGTSGTGGIGGLLKNPMVTMMIGHFISKLVCKYNMSPSSASQVANQLIPGTLSGLIDKTNDSANPSATLDNLIGSLTGNHQGNGGSTLQQLLEKFTGGGSATSAADNSDQGGFDLQDMIGQLTSRAQDSVQNRKSSGGLLDLIQGFMK